MGAWGGSGLHGDVFLGLVYSVGQQLTEQDVYDFAILLGSSPRCSHLERHSSRLLPENRLSLLRPSDRHDPPHTRGVCVVRCDGHDRNRWIFWATTTAIPACNSERWVAAGDDFGGFGGENVPFQERGEQCEPSRWVYAVVLAYFILFPAVPSAAAGPANNTQPSQMPYRPMIVAPRASVGRWSPAISAGGAEWGGISVWLSGNSVSATRAYTRDVIVAGVPRDATVESKSVGRHATAATADEVARRRQCRIARFNWPTTVYAGSGTMRLTMTPG